MKPYKFEPYLKTTIWGGYQIAPFKGIYTAQPNIGESWEISGVPGHESVAINRGLVDDVDEGLTLTQLIDKYKGLLVGQKVYKKFGNKFPLLVKFIDSRQDLSVQVHPDDKLAMERHGCAGKTEMWYVIKSDVGSKIYAGLKKSITPEDYERLASPDPSKRREEKGAAENPLSSEGDWGRLQDVLAIHEAHEGDLFFLPAGRLHAIGAGNFLAEIQQTSDITYRQSARVAYRTGQGSHRLPGVARIPYLLRQYEAHQPAHQLPLFRGSSRRGTGSPAGGLSLRLLRHRHVSVG